MLDWTVETRKRVFEEFYQLTARQVMDPTFAAAAFLPAHCPISEVLDALVDADHAWVRAEGTDNHRITSIILRRDLLQALEPPRPSYTRISRVRFHSLAHGSADCACRFTEGRVLHEVAPETPCRDVLHTMERKGAVYLPVVEDGILIGEIGAEHLVRAIRSVPIRKTTRP